VIYELCCGRPPFVGEGAGDVLVAHIHLPIPAMSKTNFEIPQPVEALVRRLLAKAPGDRLQTADKVILAIDALMFERPAHTPTPAEAATEPLATGSAMTTLSGSVVMTAERRTTRWRWSVAALAGFAAAIIAAIVTIGIRRDEDPVAEVPAVVAAPAALVAARPEPRDTPARLAQTTPVVQTAPVETTAAPVVRTSSEDTLAPAAERPASSAVIDVVVDSAPSGAEVVLGGAVQGTTPFVGHLPRGDGNAELVVRLAGYVDRTILVHLASPIRERVTLARTPVPVPKRAAPVRDRSFNPFD
jgi:serine/threonine protein kinase